MKNRNQKFFFSRLFSRKRTALDGRTDESEDYIVSENRRLDMIFRIVSVVVAIILWGYVALSDAETRTFVDVPVELRGVYTAEAANFDVEYPPTYVTVALKGTASKLNQLDGVSLPVYADFAEADLSEVVDGAAKTVAIPIHVSLPKGLICTEQSAEEIRVNVRLSETQTAE